ncbi:MAG: ABC transporter permease [Bacteroidales bacterium]|nr:ABC transporter permease [Bacteroidales bacterium]
MITNFIKVAIRNLLRHKTYIFINIFGLAIGLACSILIVLFVMYELSFDRFNEKKDNIYRVYLSGKIGESEIEGAWTAAPTAGAFLEEFPEVIDATRLDNWDEVVVKFEDQSFIEKDVILVDSSFFNIFSFPMIQGDAGTALNAPYKIVLTESTAKRYFGKEDPVGKQLRINSDTTRYTITGIVSDPPKNGHFDFTMAASFLSLDRATDDFWLSNSFNTYLLLEDGASEEELEAKIPAILEKYIGPQLQQAMGISLEEFAEAGNRYGLLLQPLLDIHLDSKIQHGLKPSSDKKYIYIFIIVALLIIIIAGINYMNLSTARSAGRSKEVGVRKVVGSTRKSLIRQFLVESVFLSFISLLVAIGIVGLILPEFNHLVNLQLDINYFRQWYILPGLLLLSLFVGILAGSYPAFYLSSFKPVAVLSGKLGSGSRRSSFRSIMVIIQFTISIIIILSTIIIYQQIRYMLDKDLGFNNEQLLVIRRAGAVGDKMEVFKQEVLKFPGALGITHSTAIPGFPNNNNGYGIEGWGAERTVLMNTCWTDFDNPDVFKFEIKEGRFLSKDLASDSTAAVINESAVKKFNLENPLGTRFIQPTDQTGGFTYLTVVGVVKDFHYQSLHDEIQPHIFIHMPKDWHWGYLTVRLAPENIKETVENIENTWKEFTSNDPMQYFFLDEEFENLYKQEKRTSKIALGFAIFSLLIACLGLYGLTSFTTEQRTREIGIRKSMGASGQKIILLLLKEILVLISISTIIAWLFTYFAMDKWLQNYYYRINLNPLTFIMAFLVAVIIALLTVSYRAIIAAKTNPAIALKYE